MTDADYREMVDRLALVTGDLRELMAEWLDKTDESED